MSITPVSDSGNGIEKYHALFCQILERPMVKRTALGQMELMSEAERIQSHTSLVCPSWPSDSESRKRKSEALPGEASADTRENSRN